MARDIIKNSIIDPTTGEVLKERTFFHYDGFNEKGYKYRYKDLNKITIYPDSIPVTLSKEGFMLLYMITEMANNDNVLVYRVTRKSKFSSIVYKPLDKEDIRERLKYKFGENKFERCWSELRKHCIKKVRYHEYMVWAINPAVISKCQQIPPWLYDEFSLYLNPHMTRLAIKKMQDQLDELK